ncbi:hypothetical protein G9A89_016965 [Geosiphon pyriformis]|nr:hypothetical protein G9A89_016965 [Geosiphon pyriformis]
MTLGNPRSKFIQPVVWITTVEFRNQIYLKPEFSELFKSPAIITKNKLLDTIFPFELKELSAMLLFSGAALEEKPITTMYTDAKVDGHSIKLILNSGSASSIITRQLINQLGCRVDQAVSAQIIMADGATKTPISKIDDFPIKVNSIIMSIKVLIMEATQYQALIGNNWLSKINATLDWNMQKLQLSQNATCGHFKTTNTPASLIEFEKEEKKPTWETTIKTNNNSNELPTWEWKEINKRKRKKKEEDITEGTTTTEEITKLELCQTKITGREPIIIASLVTVNAMAIQKNKASRTTNHVSFAECGTTFLDEDERATLYANTQSLLVIGYPHDKDKIWWMANAKVEGVMSSKILEIKNNSLEPVNIVLILNPDAFLDLEAGPKEFHEHYQNLAPIKEKQEQHLTQINT